MKLNWIQLFEKIDNTTMQEFFYSPSKKFTMNGKTIKLCPVCRRWVSMHDYTDFCQQGYHEFAIEIKPEISKQYADKLSSRRKS